MHTSNVDKGRDGQRLAERYLQSKGYTLVCANFTAPMGEIDLIVRDGAYLVFVEVKYRMSLQYGLPCEAVTPAKQRKIRKTAQYYMVKNPSNGQDCRFDVVELLETTQGIGVRHITDAF